MTAILYSFSTKQPISTIRQVPIVDLGEYRASLHYDDMLDLIKRALSAATLSDDPETRRIGRQSLEDYARWAQWPQARAICASHLRAIEGGKA